MEIFKKILYSKNFKEVAFIAYISKLYPLLSFTFEFEIFSVCNTFEIQLFNLIDFRISAMKSSSPYNFYVIDFEFKLFGLTFGLYVDDTREEEFLKTLLKNEK